MIRPSGDSTRPAIAYPKAKAMIARPSRASSERLSRSSRACWRCWLTHSFIALFISGADGEDGKLQVLLPTEPEMTLKGSSLPTFNACAASR